MLRFLEIITPVKCVIPRYDGHISYPREGDLHQKSRKSARQKVWSVNIDESRSYYYSSMVVPGLKLLWDT